MMSAMAAMGMLNHNEEEEEENNEGSGSGNSNADPDSGNRICKKKYNEF